MHTSSFSQRFVRKARSLINLAYHHRVAFFTGILVLFAFLFFEILAGPIFGSDHDMFPMRSEFRGFVTNSMTAVLGNSKVVVHDNILRQRVDDMEAQLSKLTNEGLVSDNMYKVDYFDPRNKAVTWPYYTSPEKMRDVGGWMGLFKKQVPFK